MNWIDIVLIVFIIMSMVGAAIQGIIRSVLTLVGLIVGVILASNFYEQLGSSVFGFISNETIANVVAFIVVMLAVMIVAAIVGNILRSVLKVIHLGWLDKIGGLVFGLVIGVVSAGALLAVIVKMTGTGLITDSVLSGLILDQVPLVLSFMPSEFDMIKDFFN